MTIQSHEEQNQRISPIVVVVGVLAALLVICWLILGGDKRPLKPFRPTATPGEINSNSQSIVVTFEELNANPTAYRNQRIRVTGDYTPQPKPDCLNFSGPDIRWMLVNSTLQLNSLGFEQILQLVPQGTTLTVDGIWKMYEGLFGCGKGAARKQIWYMQIEQIVQPNPLPNFDTTPHYEGTVPDVTPTPNVLPSPGADETAVPTPTIQITPAPDMTGTPIPSATAATATGTTVSPTPTPTTSNGRPTEPPSGSPTATATPTPPGGTMTATPTQSANVTNTPAATSPPLGAATAGPSPTPGSGYPGPTEPPSTPATPSPTPEPYD